MEINFENVKQLMLDADIDGDIADMTETTTFEDASIDSLDTFNILLAFEEKFGVSIPEEKTEEMNTIKKLIDFARAQK